LLGIGPCTDVPANRRQGVETAFSRSIGAGLLIPVCRILTDKRELLIDMRASLRLLAKVKPGTFLEANTPTGLTGLTTHPAPRPALILTYRQTLEKLQQLPASSVYRQSTEALTKQRLSIVESTKPAGYEEWLSRVQKQISASPEAYKSMKGPDGTYAHGRIPKERSDVWDGIVTRSSALDTGNFTEQAALERGRRIQEEVEIADKPEVPTVDDLETEPPLDAAQYVPIASDSGRRLHC
jgi:hypothetical protein